MGNWSTSVKFMGKEVQDPIARKAVVLAVSAIFMGVLILFAVALIMFPILLGLMLAVLVLTLPFIVVLHYILRMFGRQGFVEEHTSERLSIMVSGDGLRKANPVSKSYRPSSSGNRQHELRWEKFMREGNEDQ